MSKRWRDWPSRLGAGDARDGGAGPGDPRLRAPLPGGLPFLPRGLPQAEPDGPALQGARASAWRSEEGFDFGKWMRSVPVSLRAIGTPAHHRGRRTTARFGFFKPISAGNLGRRFSYWVDWGFIVRSDSLTPPDEDNAEFQDVSNAWGRFELRGQRPLLRARRPHRDGHPLHAGPHAQPSSPTRSTSPTPATRRDNIGDHQDGGEIGGTCRQRLPLVGGGGGRPRRRVRGGPRRGRDQQVRGQRLPAPGQALGAQPLRRLRLHRAQPPGPAGISLDPDWKNDILRVGIDCNVWAQRLNLYGVGMYGSNSNAIATPQQPEGTGESQHFTGGFLQADYHATRPLRADRAGQRGQPPGRPRSGDYNDLQQLRARAARVLFRPLPAGVRIQLRKPGEAERGVGAGGPRVLSRAGDMSRRVGLTAVTASCSRCTPPSAWLPPSAPSATTSSTTTSRRARAGRAGRWTRPTSGCGWPPRRSGRACASWASSCPTRPPTRCCCCRWPPLSPAAAKAVWTALLAASLAAAFLVLRRVLPAARPGAMALAFLVPSTAVANALGYGPPYALLVMLVALALLAVQRGHEWASGRAAGAGGGAEAVRAGAAALLPVDAALAGGGGDGGGHGRHRRPGRGRAGPAGARHVAARDAAAQPRWPHHRSLLAVLADASRRSRDASSSSSPS